MLSFDGRITLLKSVLGSLAIFTLSFYKAPKKIIKEITKIQSNFLWGGPYSRKIIHWVCWKVACLPIEKGGLGFRSIEDFNMVLLFKWRWRILEESKALWYNFLKTRYGDINLRVVNGGGLHDTKVLKFLWGSNILSLECKVSEEFFNNNCRFRVGNGYSLSFGGLKGWKSVFLKIFFPFFLISGLQDASIMEMGGRIYGEWKWGK